MLTSMSNWVHGAKIVLISSGVVSLALATRFAVPLMVNFTVYELPTVWTALLSLFRPPYLYVIVNVIIIIIAASARFAQTRSETSPSVDQSRTLVSARTPPPVQISAALAVEEAPPEEDEQAEAEAEALVVYDEEKVADVKKPVMVNGLQVVEDEEASNNEVVAWWSACTPPQWISSQETEMETETEKHIFLPVTAEKPPVKSRSGRRKPLKAIPAGGNAAKLAKEEREETLESVWRQIHEARRHVPRSNALENYGLEVVNVVKPNRRENRHVRKSETFQGRTNDYQHDDDGLALAAMNNSPGKIRKEPSLSQDELNRRAEEFIRKFNEEMRLQREASLKHHMNMKSNRGPTTDSN